MYYIGIDLGTSAVKLLLMQGRRADRQHCKPRISHCIPASGLERAEPR